MKKTIKASWQLHILILVAFLSVSIYALNKIESATPQSSYYITEYADYEYVYRCSRPVRAVYKDVNFESGLHNVLVPVSMREASEHCTIWGIQ